MKDCKQKISVIIPAYNAEATIGRAIASVLAQTRVPDEIIVVDDGSVDRTVDVIRSFKDRVTLIQQTNAGASTARNTGIKAASGNWIAFLDGDDEWLPEKLKLQSAHLQQNPDLRWTAGNCYLCRCHDGHRQTPEMSQETIDKCKIYLGDRAFFEDYFIAYSLLAKGHTDSTLVRRDLLFEAGLFLPGQKRMNDIDLWFRIGMIEPRFGFLFEPLAIYHLDVSDSIVKTHIDWRLIDNFLERQFALAEQSGRSDAFKPCAKIVFTSWMRPLLYDGQGTGVRVLIRRHGHLLPLSYRLSCYLGSFCPSLWKMKEQFKKRLRLVRASK